MKTILLNVSRYQIKLFSLCLLLGVLPLLTLGAFSYIRYSDVIQEKVYRGNDLLLQQAQSQIENTLKTVEFSIFQLSHSQELDKMLDMRTITPYEFQSVNALRASIQRIQLYEYGIGDIQIMNLADGWAVNNNGYKLLQDFPAGQRAEQYLQQEASTAWTTEKMLYPMSSADNRVYLVNRYPLFTPEPTLLIVTEMSKSLLFEHVPRSSDLGTVMILDRQGNAIMNNQAETVAGSLSADSGTIQNILRSGADNEYYVDVVNSAKYGVTYRKSSYNGWIYLSIVSISDITSESRALFVTTLWTSIIVFILICMVSFQGTLRLYSPVRKLYSKVLQFGGEPERTGFPDEFTTIERLYSRLHTNQSQLEGHIRKQNKQLMHFFIFKLIQGSLKSNETKEQLRLFGYDRKYRWIAVMTMQITSLQKTSYEERDKPLLLFAVSNIVEEILSDAVQLLPIVIDRFQVNIVSGNHTTEEEFKEYLRGIIEEIQRKVRSFLHLDISVGVSRFFRDYDQTPAAYTESLDALKYRFAKEKESVLFIEDVEPEGMMTLFPDNLEKQIIEAVKFVDEERAIVLLQEFLGIVSNRELSLHQIQNWLMKLLLDLIYIPEQEGIKILAVQGSNVIPLYEQLMGLQTVKEVEAWFATRIIRPIVQAMDESKGVHYNKIAQEVVRIIEREFDRDITLDECAARLNYHPSYIRRVMKQSLNCSFSQYLLQTRMEKAMKWLTETDMKISEISENLRYSNPQNFIRYFKKVTDMTPGQYREKWHIEIKNG